MRDFKGILQGIIVVALVAIAGLLFSISRKMDSQNNTPAPAATVAQPAPAPEIAAATPVPPTPAPVEAPAPTRRVENPKPQNPKTKTGERSASARPDRFADLPARMPPSDTPTPPATSAAAPLKDPNGIAYANDGSAPNITAGLPPPPMPVAPPLQPPAEPKTFTVAAGPSFRFRLLDRIDANQSRTGDTFRASLDENLIVDGTVVANRGSSVVGRLVADKQAS